MTFDRNSPITLRSVVLGRRSYAAKLVVAEQWGERNPGTSRVRPPPPRKGTAEHSLNVEDNHGHLRRASARRPTGLPVGRSKPWDLPVKQVPFGNLQILWRQDHFSILPGWNR